MDPFPALYEAFLYAAKAAPGLQKESFLEQARRFIAEGKLQARGRRFSPAVRPRRTRWRLSLTQEPWDDRVGLPVEPPALVRIPQTAMADHQLIFIAGPKTDCWATLNGSHTSGWKDVRGVAGDIERLWPHTATSPGAIAATDAGQIEPRKRGPRPEMIVSPVAKQPDYVDPIEAEQPASAQAAADTQTIVSQPVVFAIDNGTRKVIFRGGQELKGAGYGLVCALAKEFEEDIESGISKDAFRYVKANELAKRLRVDEQSLRQRVSRTRKTLEKQFLDSRDIQLDLEDVIQNEEWKGYRLNPYLLLVKPAQLQGVGTTSQLNSPVVTTPPQPR